MNARLPAGFILPRGPRRFLGLVFGMGYPVQCSLLAAGLLDFRSMDLLPSLLLIAVLWIPALAAVLAIRHAPDAPPLPSLRLPPARALLQVAIAVPALFAVVYGVTTVLHLTTPQWDLQPLRNTLLENPAPSFSAEGLANVPGGSLVVMLLLLSMFLGVTLFAAVVLGNELGWRGYLAPRLFPDHPRRGGLLSGFLWGLWLLPLVYAWHSSGGLEREFPGFALRFLVFTTAFGFALASLHETCQSIVLTAACAGVFLAQLQSHWTYLFPVASPPWTGPFGVVAIVVWLLAGCAPRLLCAWPIAPQVPPSPSSQA